MHSLADLIYRHSLGNIALMAEGQIRRFLRNRMLFICEVVKAGNNRKLTRGDSGANFGKLNHVIYLYHSLDSKYEKIIDIFNILC